MSDAEATPNATPDATPSPNIVEKEEAAVANAILKVEDEVKGDDEGKGDEPRHNSDQPNPIVSGILVLLMAFKLTMASLLVLLIAQQCPQNLAYCSVADGGTAATTTLQCFTHTCSQSEVISQLGGGGLFAFIFNFITLAALLTHQYVVWARERFLLKSFNDSEDIEDDLLGTILMSPPKEVFKSVGEQFKVHNYRVILSASVTLVIVVVNIIASAIVIFSHNDGTRSATGYLTNVVLIATVFSGVVRNARAGLWKEGVPNKKGPPKVYSLMSTEPFQWNMVRGEEAYMIEYAKAHD